MVACPLSPIRTLAIAALFALAALGCGARDLGALAESEGVPAAGIVRLTESIGVATRMREGLVELLWFEEQDGTWETQVIGSYEADEPASGRLISFGGESGQEWNSFFYGTAPPRASHMTVDRPDTAGGQVVESGWVVAMRAKDLAPSNVAWRLIDASGDQIQAGSGPFPPTR